MSKKLIVTPKKFKNDSTTIVSARVSTVLVEKIDAIAKSTNRNRNELIQMLLDFAVEQVEIGDESLDNKIQGE